MDEPAAEHAAGDRVAAAAGDSQAISPQVEYLTPRAAAIYLGTSPSTLAKLRLFGDGPPFTRIGRAVRYRRRDLDAWMAARLVTSVSHGRAAMAARGGR